MFTSKILTKAAVAEYSHMFMVLALLIFIMPRCNGTCHPKGLSMY